MRFPAAAWLALALVPACASDDHVARRDDGGSDSSSGSPGATGGSPAGGRVGSGGTNSGGSSDAAAGGTDSGTPVDSGPPEPPFDAAALTVTNASGNAGCRLSADKSSLIVTVKNTGAVEIPPTTVRLSTEGSPHEVRLKTPALQAGASADLVFDRNAAAGLLDPWQFTVVVDPDQLHGAPHDPLHGECQGVRSFTALGMAALAPYYDQGRGLWTTPDNYGWWTAANQLETVIDYTRETGDATYFDQIDNTFEKNKNGNFEGYGYYDDDGWWAIAWIKAYDLTRQQKYLDMAKTIFARMTGGWTTQCKGGIYWAGPKAGDNGNKNKNAIPNSLFMQVAAKLHQRTAGDSGAGSFVDWSARDWAWFKGTGMLSEKNQVIDSLDDLTNCKPTGPVFTYNNGVLTGGLVDLSASNGEQSILDQAAAVAFATMNLMADANGILKEPGCGGEVCTQFKGVFMRNLARLYKARPDKVYAVYAEAQADHLWTANKNDKNQFGYEWHKPFDGSTASRQSSALDAFVASISMNAPNIALDRAVTGSAPCNAGESAAYAFDGNARSTKWCSGGMGGQTLGVDLGKMQHVLGFRVRHAGSGKEDAALNTRDFEIETSADGQSWTNSVTVTGNTADVTTHPIPLVDARHIRLHVTTAQTGAANPAARVYELEVFGTSR